MKARSGQNHDSKIAPHVSFNPITKQYFFQRVWNYF